jgi:hypothetical protein
MYNKPDNRIGYWQVQDLRNNRASVTTYHFSRFKAEEGITICNKESPIGWYMRDYPNDVS